MSIKTRSRIVVFILSLLVWIALTSIVSFQEIFVGVILSFIISLIAGHFFITTEKSKNFFKRLFYAVIYFFKFIWEMIKANVNVAYIVIHPLLLIKPGIVKIKSKLSKDLALTVLTNSITLTPGTLTVDINPVSKEIYIHCIEVRSKDVDENTRSIGGKFEKILTEVFE